MSKRYSRCLSAKLGALCPPMPVFKYAMLTPGCRRQKWWGVGEGGVRRSGIFLTTRPGDRPGWIWEVPRVQIWRWRGSPRGCLHLSRLR